MSGPKQLIAEAQAIIAKINFAISVPSKKDVLRFFEIEPETIKIVILGQDPYPSKNVANGRAFAVNQGQKIPGSLRNIFQEIKEIQGEVNSDCTLEHGAKQGVLLLNTALTTELNKPLAHQHLGQDFTLKVIKYLDYNFPKIKGVLGGRQAQKFSKYITGQKIFDAHPSPLSNHLRQKNTFKVLQEING